MRTFLSYYRPYRMLLLVDLLCAIAVALVALLLPLCARRALQLISLGAPGAEFAHLGWRMLGLIVLHLACNTFVDYRGHMMGTFMERDMRRDLFAHLLRMPASFYDHQQTGQLMTRLTNDLESVSELCHHGPEDLLIGGLKFVGVFGVLAAIDVRLSLVLLGVFAAMAVYAVYFKRLEQRAFRLRLQRTGDINAQVEDTLSGMRVVQSFANEPLEQRKFDQVNAAFVASRRIGYRSEVPFYQGMAAFTQLLTVIIILIGGSAVGAGTLDVADLLTFLLYIGLLLEPIQRLINIGRLYHEGIGGFERLLEIMRQPPAIVDAPNAQPLQVHAGAIELRDVSFRYTAAQGEVLRQLSLRIAPGEYVALVGASGVGKSTLCALLSRVYEAECGDILIDQQPIRAVTLASLRQQIGVVQQDLYLFNGTIEENIRYGRPAATLDEIVAAAQQANAHEFIMALPEGYQSHIGQRGIRLSGGQKQRLSIARVMLKNPPIVIFDEATSALDNVSERAVQTALEQLSRTRTTLVIAHRLSTVRNAQRILVLTPEGIAEQGSHAELIELDGVYAALHASHLVLA